MNKIMMILLSLLVVVGLVLSSCSAIDPQEISDQVEAGESDSLEVDDTQDVVEESNDVGLEDVDEIEMDDATEIDVEDQVDEIVNNLDETVDEVVEETEEVEEDLSEIEESTSGTSYTVQFVDDGFDPVDLTIAVGDTVTWENVREGNILTAMLLGTRSYTNIKSGLLDFGETYSHTFDEAGEYIFVDGILVTYVNTITVE